MKKKALLISESSVYLDNSDDLVVRGGGAACFHNIAKTLLNLGFEVRVFSIREFPDQKAEEVVEGVFYERFEVNAKTSLNMWRYLRAALRKSMGYEVVFVNQFTPHLVLPWIKAKKIAVIHDVYHVRGWKFWRRNFGKMVGSMGYLIEKLQLGFDRRYADKLMTVSEGSKEKLIKLMGDRVHGRLHVNPYPVERKDYLNGEPKDDSILFVGRFVEYKNPIHVLEVLKKIREKYPAFKAVFVIPQGEEKLKRRFEEEKTKFFADEGVVQCVECCTVTELRKYLARAKVLVQPSMVEGQGIIVLEALASRTPVVAYDLVAYKGVLKDGENARVVEKGNVEALANACVEVLSNYEKFQKNSLNDLEKFSGRIFEQNLEEMINQ